MPAIQKITPYLWFDNQAEDAASFYVSLFENSKILNVHRNGDHAFIVEFQLDGHTYIALNGGPHFKLSEAFSLFVTCETQQEVDDYWEKLSEGGEKQMCGWVKDRFGLSWQVIPSKLMELMSDPDPAKAGRVTEAMLKMQKIDIAALQKAYDQE